VNRRPRYGAYVVRTEKRPNKILIVGGDADGNLGDRAIVISMCNAFRRLRPDIEITVPFADPARAHKCLRGTQVIARGLQGLPALIRHAWTSDLILLGGGGLFQDDDSLAKMPYWAVRLVLLRLLCRRIVGYALGVGPLESKVGRFCTRIAFCCMEHITVRDARALKTCREVTSKHIAVLPDPALLTPTALKVEALERLHALGVPQADTPLIGVAVRRWFHHRKGTWIPHKYAYRYRLRRIPDCPEYGRMVTLLARVLDAIVESHHAFVLCMPTYNVAHESDHQTCRRVLEEMRSNRADLVEIEDPRLYKAIAGHLSVMLGSRMHATILAASAGTPVIGLSYNQKFSGFFDLLGIPDQVLDLETFVAEKQTGLLYALLANAIAGRDSKVCPRLRTLASKLEAFNESLLLTGQVWA
jgi:polysaccharide pyruvyl transferase WcaK-like protein